MLIGMAKGELVDLEVQEFNMARKSLDYHYNEPTGPDSFPGSDFPTPEEEIAALSNISMDNMQKQFKENLYKSENNEPPTPDTSEEEMKYSWIQLYSGKKFYVLDPHPEDINIEDIAHALSRVCRFSGHVKCEHYSVAQHSVLVSYLCNSEDRLHALLHDASEAYIGDINSVLKKTPIFKEYKALEHKLQSMIYERFGLSTTEPISVKQTDLKMLATEARDFMSPLHPEWKQPCEPYPFKIEALLPAEAKDLFLKRYRELTATAVSGDIGGTYPPPRVQDVNWK